jgi:hypothetical protein
MREADFWLNWGRGIVIAFPCKILIQLSGSFKRQLLCIIFLSQHKIRWAPIYGERWEKHHHCGNWAVCVDRPLCPHPVCGFERVAGVRWPVIPETPGAGGESPAPAQERLQKSGLRMCFPRAAAQALLQGLGANTSPREALKILLSGKDFASLDWEPQGRKDALCLETAHSFSTDGNLLVRWIWRISGLQLNYEKIEMCTFQYCE